MTAPLIIRPAALIDRPQLRAAIVELQDYERLRHATRRPGEDGTVLVFEKVFDAGSDA